MLTLTPRASVVEARWCRREWPTQSRSRLDVWQLTCVTGVLHGKKAGWKSFDPANKPYGIKKERQLYGGAIR